MILLGRAYSHTTLHNSLGCKGRGLALVMCASTPAKTSFLRADRLVTVDYCEQTWSGNSSVADQIRYR